MPDSWRACATSGSLTGRRRAARRPAGSAGPRTSRSGVVHDLDVGLEPGRPRSRSWGCPPAGPRRRWPSSPTGRRPSPPPPTAGTAAARRAPRNTGFGRAEVAGARAAAPPRPRRTASGRPPGRSRPRPGRDQLAEPEPAQDLQRLVVGRGVPGVDRAQGEPRPSEGAAGGPVRPADVPVGVAVAGLERPGRAGVLHDVADLGRGRRATRRRRATCRCSRGRRSPGPGATDRPRRGVQELTATR